MSIEGASRIEYGSDDFGYIVCAAGQCSGVAQPLSADSAAYRPPTSRVSEAKRRLPSHGAFRRLLQACLASLLVALSVPPALLAQQTADIDLLYNDDQPRTYTIPVYEGFQSSQPFRTGTNDAGYVISEVRLWLRRVDAGAIPVVTLHRNTQGRRPGQLLYTFATPATLVTGSNSITAPGDAFLLPDTDYSLRVSAPGATHFESLLVTSSAR